MYLQPLLLHTYVAAGWYHGVLEQFQLSHDNNRQQHTYVILEDVNTV
jgi:hypothetical protein